MSNNQTNTISIQNKQTSITDYFQKEAKKEIKVYGYNSKTNSWHCLECSVDMGPNNPRQLCGKSQCLGYGY
jgi:hypothetical protein